MTNHDDTNNTDNSVYIFKTIRLLFQHRRFIIKNLIIATLLAVTFALLLPNQYQATTTILPPKQYGTSGPNLQFAEIIQTQFFSGSNEPSSKLLVEILKSDSIVRAILADNYTIGTKELNLNAYFGSDFFEEAKKELLNRIDFETSDEGIIKISAKFSNRVLAADIANNYVAKLDSINKIHNKSAAKNLRTYFANQIKQTEHNLAIADSLLSIFMISNNAIFLQEQTKTLVENAGILKGQIIAKEIELAVKKRIRNTSHSEIHILNAEVSELKNQYSKFSFNLFDSTKSNPKDLLIPASQLPVLMRKQAKFIREVKIQETVLELLNKQYYQVKINEERDISTIQVLDKAFPPTKKSKPNRGSLILLSIFCIFLLSCIYVISKHALVNFFQTESISEDATRIKGMIQDDIKNIRNFFKKK